MADSVTTQQADMKKLLAEANAIIANIRLKRAEREALAEANSQREAEAHKKLLAEANALLANSRQRRAEREAHEKLLAEALANSQLKQAEREAHKKAKPFLTTAEWLCAIYLAASLAAKALF